MHTGEPSSKRTIEQIIGEQVIGQPVDPEPPAAPQFYLWAVGLDPSLYPAGKLLSDRYMVHEAQIVSDTQTYKLPECPDEFPTLVATYLKLSCFSLQLPRPYAIVGLAESAESEMCEEQEILLLENASISANGKLMPSLADSWAKASAVRQINWLWQILHLWQPLAEFRVASTFFTTDLVRVDGCWLKILELQCDAEPREFSQLGEMWVNWLDRANPQIEESLAELFYGIARGGINLNGAIAHLDLLNAQLLQSQSLVTKTITATDPGTRRSHNEDSCYPDPNQSPSQISDFLRDRLVIICDGLGGHEGGEVASGMAIKTMKQQFEILLRQVESDQQPFLATVFMSQLNAIVRVVNDQIVALNDDQHRQAQQRMGTTLVMAVIPRPQGQPINQVFIVNVGDSRLYWINSRSCYQATIDDDVANRDILLGYNLPAYALQRIDAGSLTQALGTRSADNLAPAIQRLLIDEACVLLLCSDGLSDYERVPELWRSLVLPLLIGSQTIEKAAKSLIEQGNLRNGHDNITVGIIQCQFVSGDRAIAPNLEIEPDVPKEFPVLNPTEVLIPANEPVNSQEIEPRLAQNSPGILIGLILLIVALAVGIGLTIFSNSQETGVEQTPPSPVRTSN
jgi:protein phosphatase